MTIDKKSKTDAVDLTEDDLDAVQGGVTARTSTQRSTSRLSVKTDIKTEINKADSLKFPVDDTIP